MSASLSRRTISLGVVGCALAALVAGTSPASAAPTSTTLTAPISKPTAEPVVASTGARPAGPWARLETTARTRGTVPVVAFLDGAEGVRPTAASARSRSSVLGLWGSRRPSSLQSLPHSPIISLRATPSDLAKLRSAPGVAAVAEDFEMSQTGTSSFGSTGFQLPTWWHHAQTGLPWTTKYGFVGTGRTVVIIDSGVDATHPWLRGRVVTQACFSTTTAGTGGCPNGARAQYNATAAGVAGAAAPCRYTGCAHGTHVAHLAAGAYGAASGARIVAIQATHPVYNSVLGRWEPKYTYSDVISALSYVYAVLPTKPAAINMSLGGGRYTSVCDNSDATARQMASYVNALRSTYNVATVISSGNDNYADGIGFPACLSQAVVVGNSTLTSASGADAVYGYTRNGSNSNALVDLLAPGTDICSAVPIFLDPDGDGVNCSYIGTSMAAPQVAGAFAVMRANRPTATVSTILGALQRRGTAVLDSRNSVTRTRIDISRSVYYW